MIISHKFKFIFIHIHRTGGTSLYSTLLKEDRNLFYKNQHGNIKTSDVSLIYEYPEYLKFSIIRNPWYRIFSWFNLLNYNILNDCKDIQFKFEEFLNSETFLSYKHDNNFHYNQWDYLAKDDDNLCVDQLIKFENLEFESDLLFRQLGIKTLTIKHCNKGNLSNYKQFLTPTSTRIIEDICSKDIDKFHYPHP